MTVTTLLYISSLERLSPLIAMNKIAFYLCHFTFIFNLLFTYFSPNSFKGGWKIWLVFVFTFLLFYDWEVFNYIYNGSRKFEHPRNKYNVHTMAIGILSDHMTLKSAKTHFTEIKVICPLSGQMRHFASLQLMGLQKYEGSKSKVWKNYRTGTYASQLT